MTNTLPDAVQAVVDTARSMMRVSTEDSSTYDCDRAIKNGRFDRRPTIIAFCTDTEHVQFWFRQANKVPELGAMRFVVRSGGHQHEGRSADGDAVVLDVSHFASIGDVAADDTVWIGSGAPLGAVVAKLRHDRKVLPVGGCGSVRAGGLTHGGGWGLSWRHVGMTIDSLIEAEIVTPDGNVHMLSAESVGLDKDLFWAIRGGGGGNFGVVTKLRFQVADEDPFIDFRLSWATADRFAAASAWTDLLAAHDRAGDRRLDGFCRMTVTHRSDTIHADRPVSIGGWFRGSLDELRDVLAPVLAAGEDPIFEHVQSTFHQAYAALAGRSESDEDSAPASDSARTALDPYLWAMQLGAPQPDGPPTSTCAYEPQRHKVSSAFPLDDDPLDEDPHALLRALADHFDASELIDGSNLYVSLHGMGGAARHKTDTAYSWRDKPYLAQIQAWWTGAQHDEACLAWVTETAEAIRPVSQGAFISFPDESQTIEDYYDAATLVRLGRLKGAVDIHHRLKFPLSVGPIFGD